MPAETEQSPPAEDTRIPVTVITGWLGSGKTTLLNHLLKQDHGHRLAIIENEFGEVDIDSDLVSVREELANGEEQIMMLNNGCLCCTVRDDLVEMLNKLSERRGDFDRIVIETTGLANPAPIIQTFYLEESVATNMKLDGVVTVVDAKHVGQHLDEKKPGGAVNEALEQVAYADRIILNKTDLVTGEELEDLRERLRGINSMATVLPTTRAQVSVDYVLGVGGFDLTRVDDELLKEGPETEAHSHVECAEDHVHTEACGHKHDHHGHDHSHKSHHHHHHHHDAAHHHHHHHDDAVKSVSLVLDGEMDVDKVNFWLGALVEMRSDDLYRMKGVLAVKGFDRRFVCQGVHMLFEGLADRPWRPDEPRSSKMVFIGKDLDADLLREGFEACRAKDE